MAIRISETLYFVRDMDEAIKFYSEQVGFKLDQRFDWGFAVLSLDGGKLALMLESAWDREYPDNDEVPHPRLALQTDHFSEEMRRLRSMGVSFSTINGKPGQRQSVTFFDTDDNAIYLWTDPQEAMD